MCQRNTVNETVQDQQKKLQIECKRKWSELLQVQLELTNLEMKMMESASNEEKDRLQNEINTTFPLWKALKKQMKKTKVSCKKHKKHFKKMGGRGGKKMRRHGKFEKRKASLGISECKTLPITRPLHILIDGDSLMQAFEFRCLLAQQNPTIATVLKAIYSFHSKLQQTENNPQQVKLSCVFNTSQSEVQNFAQQYNNETFRLIYGNNAMEDILMNNLADRTHSLNLQQSETPRTKLLLITNRNLELSMDKPDHMNAGYFWDNFLTEFVNP